MRQWLIHPDYLVGGVAVAIGMLVMLAAVVNHEGTFQLRKMHWIETRWGRSVARIVCGTVGAALVALGILIAL